MDEVYSLNRQVKKKAMSSLAMEFFIKCCFVYFQLKIIMKSAEFMLLITAIDELDHHQRKLLSAALNQLSDELKVLELIETCLKLEMHARIVRTWNYTVTVWLTACNVILQSVKFAENESA